MFALENLLITAPEFGSTGAVSILWFHGLFAGKIRLPWRLALLPRSGVPSKPRAIPVKIITNKREATRNPILMLLLESAIFFLLSPAALSTSPFGKLQFADN
jgi:hypothetical protein